MTRWRFVTQSLVLSCGMICLTACATTAVDTASGEWHEIRTARFRAVTDTDPEEAAELLQDLERFHRVVLLSQTWSARLALLANTASALSLVPPRPSGRRRRDFVQILDTVAYGANTPTHSL